MKVSAGNRFPRGRIARRRLGDFVFLLLSQAAIPVAYAHTFQDDMGIPHDVAILAAPGQSGSSAAGERCGPAFQKGFILTTTAGYVMRRAPADSVV